MQDFKRHLIQQNASLKDALQKLNDLAADAILFVVDENMRLKGSLTDGDVRRGILRGLTFDTPVNAFIQPNPKFLQRNNYSIEKVIEYRNLNFKILPVVDEHLVVINVVNFRYVVNFRLTKSYLPVDAVIMAGGRGERLRPMTDTVPKPMLQLGSKPIIRYNLDRLIQYGIDDIWISVRYLGDQIRQHLQDGSQLGARIQYVYEDVALGTIGAVREINLFNHPYVLVANSDLLTNLDYEDFFIDFVKKDAALSVVTIPYTVNIPYAVLETANGHVINFKEKPNYTYYSNGGIYLLKKEIIERIPKGTFFNATDLMEQLIAAKEKVISYPMYGYWLDVGKPEDYNRAKEDIVHIKF
jgi:dTDP-glucose pyrophosphorylase